MGILFGINKPRGYHHIPIYYDPEKEEREKRLKTEDPKQQEEGEYRIRLQRGSFRRSNEREELDQYNRQRRLEILKLALLLCVLIVIGVFVYFCGAQLLSLYLD